MVRNNAVAILYPYARAIVATLTTTSNEFPGYNMPTINVNKVLAQQDEKD
ncbi:MAG: protein-export chaperone SecB [Liquorilactobacillus nagelii]|nr:protein-export chaperone SecB [Liquorilactobacillus nagelii]MCI1632814.1 protein-export chaperone SecB [Liquorilactobacillus nagelii]